jgi:F-type H+-transporting ATPase subunit epsilon
MTNNHLTVSLVTPERQVAMGEMREVRAPSVLGQVGILPAHRPLLAELEAGVVELVDAHATVRIAVSGGVLEVDRDRVAILAETAERANEIDVERARRAFAGAEEQLAKLSPTDEGYDELRARAERARVRLEAAGARP